MIQGIKDCKFEPIDHTSAIIKIKLQRAELINRATN